MYDPSIAILAILAIAAIAVVVYSIVVRPLKVSGRLQVKALTEQRSNGMDIIKFKVTLPKVTDPQVKFYALSVSRSENANELLANFEIIDIARDFSKEIQTYDIEALQDSTVSLSCKIVDECNNATDCDGLEFVAVDTIPPTAEGRLSVVAISERSVPDPVVAAPATSDPEIVIGDIAAEQSQDAAALGDTIQAETPPATE